MFLTREVRGSAGVVLPHPSSFPLPSTYLPPPSSILSLSLLLLPPTPLPPPLRPFRRVAVPHTCLTRKVRGAAGVVPPPPPSSSPTPLFHPVLLPLCPYHCVDVPHTCLCPARCEELLEALEADYSLRAPYLAYLIRSRQGLLATQAHVESIMEKVDRYTAVPSPTTLPPPPGCTALRTFSLCARVIISQG